MAMLTAMRVLGSLATEFGQKAAYLEAWGFMWAGDLAKARALRKTEHFLDECILDIARKQGLCPAHTPTPIPDGGHMPDF